MMVLCWGDGRATVVRVRMVACVRVNDRISLWRVDGVVLHVATARMRRHVTVELCCVYTLAVMCESH